MKKSTRKIVKKFLGGAILIVIGIIAIALHVMKILPDGWENASEALASVLLMWAYSGLFLGSISIIAGLYVWGVIDYATDRFLEYIEAEEKRWPN